MSKADFRTRKIIRNKEKGRGVTFPGRCTIFHVHVSNNRTSTGLKYKLIELQNEMDKCVVRDINAPLSVIHTG